MRKKEQKEIKAIDDEKFLSFSRSYLSEAFPNPQRNGCPADSDLRQMAEHPKESDAPISQHLTCCSPCFNRYMDLLGELKKRKLH